jgi:hypothetical protein
VQHAHVLHRCVAHLGMRYSSPLPKNEMHPLLFWQHALAIILPLSQLGQSSQRIAQRFLTVVCRTQSILGVRVNN